MDKPILEILYWISVYQSVGVFLFMYIILLYYNRRSFAREHNNTDSYRGDHDKNLIHVTKPRFTALSMKVREISKPTKTRSIRPNVIQ